MLLRVRNDGYAFCRRVCPHSPHRASQPLSQTAASARPHGLNSTSPYPVILRPQLRVLRTWTHNKGSASQSQNGAQYPQTTAQTTHPSLNWTATAHRTRHIAATMATQTQSRGHAGHSHHHHHDNTFLLSKNKNDAGVRITRIGLYVNLGMAVSKGFGGYVFNSQGKHTTAAKGEGGQLLTQHSAHRRCHSQPDRSRQRRHDARNRGLVAQAPFAAISQWLRESREPGLIGRERYTAGGRLHDGLVSVDHHHAAVFPRIC